MKTRIELLHEKLNIINELLTEVGNNQEEEVPQKRTIYMKRLLNREVEQIKWCLFSGHSVETIQSAIPHAKVKQINAIRIGKVGANLLAVNHMNLVSHITINSQEIV